MFIIKDHIGNFLGKFPSICHAARISYQLMFATLDKKLCSVLKNRENIYFIQIGANDGSSNDPLCGLIQVLKGWKGIFVEPVKYYYDRLVKKYGNESRFIFENVAIGEKEGKAVIYYLLPDIADKYPDLWWAFGVGSLDKQHLIRTCGDRIAGYIQEDEIQMTTFESLCRKNNVSHVDVIVIDTEGYDYKILQQINLRKYCPEIVAYEYKHLKKDEKRAAHKMLSAAGYKLSTLGDNVLAIKTVNPC